MSTNQYSFVAVMSTKNFKCEQCKTERVFKYLDIKEDDLVAEAFCVRCQKKTFFLRADKFDLIKNTSATQFAYLVNQEMKFHEMKSKQ